MASSGVSGGPPSSSTHTHAAPNAVQVNVLGRGGTVGQPMFISTLSGSVRLSLCHSSGSAGSANNSLVC